MDTDALRSRPFKPGAAQHARSVHALMLRDIKTRFGASYFGFLFGLFIPLAHIGVVMTIYIMLGRRAALGTDVAVYLSTAIVPFIVWSYTHQRIIQSFSANRALTSFPVIKFIDIFIARALAELLNASLIVAVTLTALSLVGADLFIYDPPSALATLFMAYFLGLSTGFLLGVLSLLYPVFGIVGYLFIPIYWGSCGVFFIPEALPEQLRNVLMIFPLSHLVDFGRMAFYASYISAYPMLLYVWAVILGNILTALVLERSLRPILTAR